MHLEEESFQFQPHTRRSSGVARSSSPGCGQARRGDRQGPGHPRGCLRNWMSQADISEGRKEGLTSDERAELVRLRWENRVQAMEIEILKRASA